MPEGLTIRNSNCLPLKDGRDKANKVPNHWLNNHKDKVIT